jgi:hypothetical protein
LDGINVGNYHTYANACEGHGICDSSTADCQNPGAGSREKERGGDILHCQFCDHGAIQNVLVGRLNIRPDDVELSQSEMPFITRFNCSDPRNIPVAGQPDQTQHWDLIISVGEKKSLHLKIHIVRIQFSNDGESSDLVCY